MAESLVNELTGETSTPPQYVAELKRLEREVTRMDDVLATLKAEVKAAKEGRDKAVQALRSAVREVKSIARAAKQRAAKR